ncbi:hypothetical protein [Pedobacter nutrimenti]|uniref:hypothetical protein n=1 Tax=Pedobacter nutrimenti TaxID=1241337 RepID=UPI00292F680F|nr:hypothetical protein [Pedobacter nutrimenti]
MKKIIFSSALMLAAAISFANNPKETKESTPSTATKSETKEVVTKWFHFTGNASIPGDLQNASLYAEESTPVCPTTPNTYRCDILIQVDPNDDSMPDLSQPIQQERKRSSTTQ